MAASDISKLSFSIYYIVLYRNFAPQAVSLRGSTFLREELQIATIYLYYDENQRNLR